MSEREDVHPWEVKNPVTGESIDDLVARMTPAQREDFARRVLARLERAAEARLQRPPRFFSETGA